MHLPDKVPQVNAVHLAGKALTVERKLWDMLLDSGRTKAPPQLLEAQEYTLERNHNKGTKAKPEELKEINNCLVNDMKTIFDLHDVTPF